MYLFFHKYQDYLNLLIKKFLRIYFFEDILNSIGSKEYMRDRKLEQILGEDKEEEKTEEKKKWLW